MRLLGFDVSVAGDGEEGACYGSVGRYNLKKAVYTQECGAWMTGGNQRESPLPQASSGIDTLRQP